jgi:ATP-binding cassette subfamily G (WHITE) protein 2 (PDR)
LSVEQRKILSIAVEVVSKPDVLLFLGKSPPPPWSLGRNAVTDRTDEPTSGLDGQAAWSVCSLLRRLADDGQTILCTIHQPSASILQLFDRLLLLNGKGQTVYFGEVGKGCASLKGYLEGVGAATCPTVPGSNPAEWAMAAISAVPSGVTKGPPVLDCPHQFWHSRWVASLQKQEIARHVASLRQMACHEVAAADDRKGRVYEASIGSQLAMVVPRMFQQYWRDPIYLYSKLALCAGLSLVDGLSFLNTRLDIQGFTNLLFSTFLLTQLFGTLTQQVIPQLMHGRAIFEARERPSRTYSWAVFLAGHVSVELAWQTAAALLVFVAWYLPTGMWRLHDTGPGMMGAAERGGLMFLLVWLFCLWTGTLSQAVAAGLEHAEIAIQIATLLFWLSLVFCGILMPPSDLPGFWTFVYRATPLTHFINGGVLAGLGGLPIACSVREALEVAKPPGASSMSCGEYLLPHVRAAGGYVLDPEASDVCRVCPFAEANSILARLGMEIQNPWVNVGYMFCYVVFNVFAMFGIYWAVRQRAAR